MVLMCRAFLIFFIYSFCGFVIEVSFKFLGERKLTLNRGFLIGPYLPIFGVGSMIILYPLQRYENDIFALFVSSFLLCGLLEYLTSHFMEKFFGFRWWDYSDKKYNINGRVCLKNLFLFGIVGIFLVEYANPIVMNFINSLNNDVLIYGTLALFIVFMSDVILSVIIANQLKHKLVLDKIKDSTKEIKAEVRKTLENSNIFVRRILSCFPDIREILGIPKLFVNSKKVKKETK